MTGHGAPERAMAAKARRRVVGARRVALSATLVAALVLSACAHSSGTAAPSGTAGSSPATQVVAAYRGMWSDLVASARTSDYQSPLLADHATGAALALFVRGLARDQLHHIVTRGKPVIHPSVTSLTPVADPARATVADCVDDAQWIEYTASGARAKNPHGGRRSTTADLVQSHGTWKVSAITVGAVGSC